MSSSVRLAWLTVLIIALTMLLTYLATRSGRGYSPERTKEDADDFGGAVQEGHGGMTAFLWLSFVAIVVWSVVYLVMHWNEFATTFFDK